MSKFFDTVEAAKKELRNENLRIVRDMCKNPTNYSSKDIVALNTKIQNFLISWGDAFTKQEIIEGILTNDIIAAKFAKEPGRQNISEKKCAEILGWSKLPAYGVNSIHFDTDGNITSIAPKDKRGVSKSADFCPNGRYITQKVTKESGGSQDNQFQDVVQFLTNGSIKHKCGACVDGPFWDDEGNKMKLIEMFKHNPNVIIFGVDEILEKKIIL